MGIPSPEYDTVLLREHLFEDTKKKFLVLPSSADDSHFQPIRRVGLGLFEYHFAQGDEVSSTMATFKIVCFEFLRDVCILLLVFGSYCFIYKCMFGSFRIFGNRVCHKKKLSDIEEAFKPEQSQHTPMPSLSYSFDTASPSPQDSPSNVFIRRINLPDYSSGMKVSDGYAFREVDSIRMD